MRKLSLYFNEDQFEKLQILLGEEDEEKIEEFLNETLYDIIYAKWIEDKTELLADQIEDDEIEEETIRFTLDGIDYDIFLSDDGTAVITEGDRDCIVQMVEGRLYFTLNNGNLVPCDKPTEERLLAALSHAGIALTSYDKQHIDGIIISELGEPFEDKE